jgi:signal peptidase I
MAAGATSAAGEGGLTEPSQSEHAQTDVLSAHTAAKPAAISASAQSRRSPLKTALRVSFAVCLLAILARVACVSGWLRPIRIVGGSMAETLLGDHWRIHCPRCGFTHRCDREQLPRDERVVCPNCGVEHDVDKAAMQVRGQRVLVDRWLALWGDWRSRRGAVVAVRRDDAPSGFAVKRLIGFPGETIEIRDGDIWLGPDVRYRKSWQELSAVAIPVHDDHFRIGERADREDIAPRRAAGWRPLGSDSGWQATPAGYRWSSRDRRANEAGWLVFQTAAGTGVIRDLDAYNQALSRHLEAVNDLMLRLDVDFADSAILMVDLWPARRPGVRFEFSKSGGGRIWTLDEETPRLVKQWAFPILPAADTHQRLGVAYCDQQAMVALHDREWARIDLEGTSGSTTVPTGGSRSAVAIGAMGGRVEISKLRLLRDIHYLPASNPDSPRTWRLERDEWFVLGDNAAASTDSREWSAGSVRTRHFVGEVHSF